MKKKIFNCFLIIITYFLSIIQIQNIFYTICIFWCHFHFQGCRHEQFSDMKKLLMSLRKRTCHDMSVSVSVLLNLKMSRHTTFPTKSRGKMKFISQLVKVAHNSKTINLLYILSLHYFISFWDILTILYLEQWKFIYTSDSMPITALIVLLMKCVNYSW